MENFIRPQYRQDYLHTTENSFNLDPLYLRCSQQGNLDFRNKLNPVFILYTAVVKIQRQCFVNGENLGIDFFMGEISRLVRASAIYKEPHKRLSPPRRRGTGMEPEARIEEGERRPPELMDLPSDVLVRILGLLDGPTLASATSASSYLHSLSNPLWRELCRANWPSTVDPRVSSLLRRGFHSLFSDAFPGLCPLHPPAPRPTSADRLFSAVDLRCGGALVFSRVVETETQSGWFLSSPFRIDALDGSELPPAAKAASPLSPSYKSLEAELTLSWVVIDPAGGRAADFSSRRPVSVQRHWLTGEIQVRFAIILERVPAGSSVAEPVQVGILVTCDGGGEDEHVREVSLQVEDVEGMSLNGEDTLVVLQDVMEGHRRKKKEDEEEEEMLRYMQFLEQKRVNKEKKMTKEGRLDMACVLVGLLMFAAFCAFLF
ncbi:hypothetical protein H6P81_003542 [Aristolochia fimbriata]|uniref:F-box domain-containing protein n=1 Tax=Aristolochia fimbriata TaxID=158543 RepID=A0AAV7FEM7_ARIFI|nr:hypothetical protein H6P81_003542 [Aristolochia fimbriata]